MNIHEQERIADAMNREWRWIPGYEGTYQVSASGDIMSSARPTTPGGLLKWNLSDRHGYPRVTLVQKGRQKKFRVHVLVALAFLGPKPQGMEIRHLNGRPGDPSLANLAYGTHQDNMRDMRGHGTCSSSNKTNCPSGHPYDEVNTLRSGGRRYCRACAHTRAAKP